MGTLSSHVFTVMTPKSSYSCHLASEWAWTRSNQKAFPKELMDTASTMRFPFTRHSTNSCNHSVRNLSLSKQSPGSGHISPRNAEAMDILFACFVTGGHFFCRILWIKDGCFCQPRRHSRPPKPSLQASRLLPLSKPNLPPESSVDASRPTLLPSSRTCGTNLCDPYFVFRCDIIVLFKPSRHPLTPNVAHHLVLEGGSSFPTPCAHGLTISA